MKFNTTARHLAIGLVFATTGASALAGPNYNSVQPAATSIARCEFSPVRVIGPGNRYYQKFMATQKTGTTDCPSFAGATSFDLFVGASFKGVSNIQNPGFPSGHNYAGVPKNEISYNSFGVEVLMRNTKISRLEYYKRYASNATQSNSIPPGDLIGYVGTHDLRGELPTPNGTQVLKVIFSAPRRLVVGADGYSSNYEFTNSYFKFYN